MRRSGSGEEKACGETIAKCAQADLVLSTQRLRRQSFAGIKFGSRSSAIVPTVTGGSRDTRVTGKLGQSIRSINVCIASPLPLQKPQASTNLLTMADYSRYGGISPNWDAFMAKNPQPELSPGLSPVQLREMTNKAREKNSREIIATIGTAFLVFDVFRITDFIQRAYKLKTLRVRLAMDKAFPSGSIN